MATRRPGIRSRSSIWRTRRSCARRSRGAPAAARAGGGGRLVYFTAEMNRALGRYDPKADKVDRIVGLGREATHMVVASPEREDALHRRHRVGLGERHPSRHRQARAIAEVGGEPEGIDDRAGRLGGVGRQPRRGEGHRSSTPAPIARRRRSTCPPRWPLACASRPTAVAS